jgi:hypothetical protein
MMALFLNRVSHLNIFGITTTAQLCVEFGLILLDSRGRNRRKRRVHLALVCVFLEDLVERCLLVDVVLAIDLLINSKQYGLLEDVWAIFFFT